MTEHHEVCLFKKEWENQRLSVEAGTEHVSIISLELANWPYVITMVSYCPFCGKRLAK